jgi:hypothetical protein
MQRLPSPLLEWAAKSWLREIVACSRARCAGACAATPRPGLRVEGVPPFSLTLEGCNASRFLQISLNVHLKSDAKRWMCELPYKFTRYPA